jgi:prepilin-type N-terminal cleavage/methylation domain-containing protein
MNIIKSLAPNNLPRQTVDPNLSGPAPNVLDTAFYQIKRSGFTLIELLVAVSIFSVIAVVLYACFRGGVLSYRKISEEAGAQQRLRYVLSAMEKDLKNVFFLSNLPFSGDDNRLYFTTIISDNEKAPVNTGYISYYLKRSSSDYILVKKIQTLQEALTLVEEEAVYVEEEPLSGLSQGEEIFIEGIASINFSYLYVEKQQSGLTETGSYEDETVFYEWVDSWEKGALPFAIKAEIMFSDSAGIGPRKITKQIWIPAASVLKPEPFDV